MCGKFCVIRFGSSPTPSPLALYSSFNTLWSHDFLIKIVCVGGGGTCEKYAQCTHKFKGGGENFALSEKVHFSRQLHWVTDKKISKYSHSPHAH